MMNMFGFSFTLCAMLLVQDGYGIPPDKPELCSKAPVITRLDWGARAPVKDQADFGDVPRQNVIIHHTVTPECFTKESCSKITNSIQKYHIDTKKFPDIGYNFLIGGDGNVYEGVGWHKVGTHTKGYNTKSIGISFIGNYVDKLPSAKMLETLKNFLRCGVSLGQLAKDYKLIAARQVRNTKSPGQKFYDELKKMPHFSDNPSTN